MIECCCPRVPLGLVRAGEYARIRIEGQDVELVDNLRFATHAADLCLLLSIVDEVRELKLQVFVQAIAAVLREHLRPLFLF